MTRAGKPAPLIGVETAREFYIDGIADIHFLGVNTRYVLFKNAVDAKNGAVRKVEFTVVMPTGGLFQAVRTLTAYMIDHRIGAPHDATRA